MYGYSMQVLGRSSTVRIRPAKQSSVKISSTSPGFAVHLQARPTLQDHDALLSVVGERRVRRYPARRDADLHDLDLAAQVRCEQLVPRVRARKGEHLPL